MRPQEHGPERVARNDAIFREANESIGDAAREYGVQGPVPFICECADSGCTAIIRLTLEEYERVRAQPTLFINARGHRAAAGAHVDVAEERDGYEVVKKLGEAAEVAEELDTRSA